MTPAPHRHHRSDSFPARRWRRALTLMLLPLTVASGCAGRRSERYWNLGSNTPPPLNTEPVVRSQDSLARRQPRSKAEKAQAADRQQAEQLAQSSPAVQWSDTPGTAAPKVLATSPATTPALVTLPPPPTIPAGPGEATPIPAISAPSPTPSTSLASSRSSPAPEPAAATPEAPRTELAGLAAPTLAAPTPFTAAANPAAPALTDTAPAPAAPLDATTTTPPAAPAPAAVSPYAQMRALIDAGRQQLASMTNYQVSMARQERVGDQLQPAETVLLSLRREPLAVRLEWPEGKNQGREVIYAVQETNGQMQIHSPGTLVPRMTLAPTSPLVMRNSRHPITEAGFGGLLDTLDRSLQPHEQGLATRARMVYAGVETPSEVGRPCHKLVEDRENGEHWEVFLDTANSLPTLVHGTNAQGELLEHYVFGPVQANLADLATATAFDPDSRWGGRSGGLLGRLSRGGNASQGGTSGPR